MTTAHGTWHMDQGLVRRYVAAGTDAVTSASIEAHLLRCADCRSAIATESADDASAQRRAQIWDGVVDRIDAPRVGPLERVLHRLGIREDDARLLSATPSLQASWLAALLLVLGFAVAAAHRADGARSLFLAIAPLLPVAGVAAAYGPDVDPAYELGIAAPYRTIRLLMLRTATVLIASLGLTGAAALALPVSGWSQVAWLLPGLGLTLTTLALSTRLTPAGAGGAVAVAWVAVVLRLAQLDRTGDVAGSTSQLFFLALILIAAAAVVVRRDRLDMRSSA